MQKWEYMYINRQRWLKERPKDSAVHSATEWENQIMPGGTWPYKNINEAIGILGESGWELVAITSRSGIAGGMHEIKTGGATSVALTADYAGFTTSEAWVFKRPKE
jgi:hypothetical protein